MRTTVGLELLAKPKGRLLWFPTRARTEAFGVEILKGKVIRKTEPDFIEIYRILPSTIKFDQGLVDGFFSTLKHALVSSDESLAKLKRELESTKPASVPAEPSDPESLKRRLDDALERADAQAARLEASSAAKAAAHWSAAVIPWAVLLVGVPLVGFLIHRARGRR